MFERLKEAVRSLASKIVISDRDIENLLRELKRDLIYADVDIKIAKKIVEEVKDNINKSIDKRKGVIFSLYETLSKYMGLGKEIEIKKFPFKIMLIGLFGSGKTTTAGKLAYYFKKKGYKVALVQTDNYRPASFDQLKQLGEKIKVKVFDMRKDLKGFEELEKKYEVIIVDTAGRTVLDDDLMKEIRKIKEKTKPDMVILVIPAEIGIQAKREIEGFNPLGIDGIIVTRMDGSAKGGGALTASYITGAPIFFIGVGEKIEDLEKFDPKGFVGRLLGLGDVKSLIEKIEEEIKNKEELERKIREGKIDLYFLKEQIEAMEKIGPIEKIISMIPGLGLSIDRNMLNLSKEKIKKFKAIFNSLRKSEFKNPEKIRKRIKEIAYGAGVSEQDVLELLNAYYQMKKLLKLMKRRDFERMLKKYINFGL